MRLPLSGSALVAFLAVTRGQSQTLPTPHALGSTLSTSAQAFNHIGQIVPLGDGRLFVADAGGRIVRILDPTLATSTTVLDSAAGRSNSFSSNSFLMPFRGDSALFYDRVPGVFVVVGPDGGLGRVMAAPPTIWDVINHRNEIVDRVSIPVSQTVIGFGAGGIVYTTVSDAGIMRLVKSRVK